ncbi:ketopantoate reductase family protein [Allosediminivita pacifica]|uniref:2-dehydropantoate 2-reductase n=1 Tax=Allosediminivita pacifica TaxID=1267769 RepID=A0A2T6ATJ1_9RHOB|nr:2-dehydropantoate 2-reductase N-terminal domain-containing protein [Allosediminivita pacifica]PTX47138.1 2-dehydropantoate 2-reductase [Allosediminivita pacifica]
MRVIIYGVGAVGGVIGAALVLKGIEVVGIARGGMLEAIREKGLRLRGPEIDTTVRFQCVSAPADIDFRPDDAILLCMKTQDTEMALEELREAGVRDQPIFCMQNGVENERLACRYFPNVHAVTVMLPGQYLAAGEVVTHGAPCFGMLEIGRYPQGSDTHDELLSEMLTDARIRSFFDPTVMESKYGKLLLNLTNIVGAALGTLEGIDDIRAVLVSEAEAVYAAAGITFRDVGQNEERRREFMIISDVPGVERKGSSTSQSLLRNTGRVETDYLNGEIVLLGRLHGIPTPANAWFTELGAKLAREGRTPGSVTRAEVTSALGL